MCAGLVSCQRSGWLGRVHAYCCEAAVGTLWVLRRKVLHRRLDVSLHQQNTERWPASKTCAAQLHICLGASTPSSEQVNTHHPLCSMLVQPTHDQPIERTFIGIHNHVGPKTGHYSLPRPTGGTGPLTGEKSASTAASPYSSTWCGMTVNSSAPTREINSQHRHHHKNTYESFAAGATCHR